MNVRELPDVAALWRVAEVYLSSDPANNTHQLSAAKRIMDIGARYRERFFAVYADDAPGEFGGLIASAICVDSKALFLAVMSPDCASALATHLRQNDVRLAGVIGRRDVARSRLRASGHRRRKRTCAARRPTHRVSVYRRREPREQ